MDNNTNQPAVGKEPVEQEDKQKKRLQNEVDYAESRALVFAGMLLIFTFIARKMENLRKNSCARRKLRMQPLPLHRKRKFSMP